MSDQPMPLLDRWELEACSQSDDIVLAYHGGRAYWWRVTASLWPEFPGPRWTEVPEPLPSHVPDCFVLVRGTGDPVTGVPLGGAAIA